MKKSNMQKNINFMKGLLLLNLIPTVIEFALCLIVIFLGLRNNRRYDLFEVSPDSLRAVLLFVILSIIFGLFSFVFLRAFIILQKRKIDKLFIVKLASFFLICTSMWFIIMAAIIHIKNLLIFFIIVGILISIYSLVFMFRPKTDEIKALFSNDVTEDTVT